VPEVQPQQLCIKILIFLRLNIVSFDEEFYRRAAGRGGWHEISARGSRFAAIMSAAKGNPT
jgi:hypothetical protein